MKIIFCEKNKELLKKVKEVFKNETNNLHCELITEIDVFKAKKKYPNALITTTSNPDFSMGGGLDALIKEKYPEQCQIPREFKFTKDLFFTITVDKNIKSSKSIVQRALLGIYFASRKNDIIFTGLGTGIGGLSIDDFISELKKFVNADFSYADFSFANFYSADFSFANFYSADFSSANFYSADFSSADFYSADFRFAKFNSADFRFAKFNSADFSSANFSYADFGSADFYSADFRFAKFNSANFNSANFSYADFGSADFYSADFRFAKFNSANFNSANFRFANFHYADFNSADFRFANFNSANFRSANFYFANFNSANFNSANFSYANFSSANFNSANFSYANFSSANFKNSIFNYRITPETGKFIGWKKAQEKIIKLEIQKAENVSGGLVGRKLRTDKVKVLEIQDKEGKKLDLKSISSDYNEKFIYNVGKIITEKDFKKDDKIECDKGIHFFITRDEAVRY
jgi:uncharacterized protein YjbI with pentapeptide repeats